MGSDGFILLLFFLFLAVILFLLRARLHVESFISVKKVPVLYLALLRTKIGINLMDRISTSFPFLVSFMANFGIVVGFLGMLGVIFELVVSTVKIFILPQAPGAAALVLPIEAPGVVFVPPVVWLICLAIIIGIHEFSHGVVARLYKVPIKSTGFAALGFVLPLIPAAFVEPDEKELAKKSPWQQIGIFSAGPCANIVLALMIIPIIMFVTTPRVDSLYAYEGVRINEITSDQAYPITQSALASGALITQLDGQTIDKMETLSALLSSKKQGDTVSITVKRNDEQASYEIPLGKHPSGSDAGYLGIVGQTEKTMIHATWYSVSIAWLHELLLWLATLNMGVGLFNLLPFWLVDGGRIARVLFGQILQHGHAQKAFAVVSSCCLMIVLFGVAVNFLR